MNEADETVATTRPPPPVRGQRIKRILALAFGLLGLGGMTFLAIGMALARPWTAERSIAIAAAPGAVFLYLDSLALWDAWTLWGDVPSEFTGPGRGTGAGRSWDNAQYGEGQFVIRQSHAPESLAYEVEVEGGKLTISGQLDLEILDGSTVLTWSEEGDFGRNPLLGYMVESMGDSQGQEMERSLGRLKELLERGSQRDLEGS